MPVISIYEYLFPVIFFIYKFIKSLILIVINTHTELIFIDRSKIESLTFER